MFIYIVVVVVDDDEERIEKRFPNSFIYPFEIYSTEKQETTS
jgi:hypothetical protein